MRFTGVRGDAHRIAYPMSHNAIITQNPLGHSPIIPTIPIIATDANPNNHVEMNAWVWSTLPQMMWGRIGWEKSFSMTSQSSISSDKVTLR